MNGPQYCITHALSVLLYVTVGHHIVAAVMGIGLVSIVCTPATLIALRCLSA